MNASDSSTPCDAFEDWLEISWNSSDGYERIYSPGEKPQGDVPAIALKHYFESAHRDARTHFHDICKIDLHPASNGSRPVEYPNRITGSTRSGLFGEVMCGVVAETFLLTAENREFKVPAFLFRFHDAVEEALNKLRFGGDETDFGGRPGDDFLALEVNESGRLSAILVGEAKYRGTWKPSIYKTIMFGDKIKGKAARKNNGVLHSLNRSFSRPPSITKLSRILKEVDEDEFAVLIADLDEVILGDRTVDRIDLVLLVYDIEGAGVKPPPPFSPTIKPPQYLNDRSLVIAEIGISQAQKTIDFLYDHLYR